MKKQHLFRLFSAIFDTQQSKVDVMYVKVTLFIDLTFIAFERYCLIVLPCQVWW